ncbi:MAG: glycosyltransferase [bacterium]|nr:glycosyltransferase [bacterium]
MNIRISLLIPCYNYAHFLGQCLESVLSQTYPYWEAVVVDDASTRGNPAEVVEKADDSRIRLIRHDNNRGISATFNTAFKHSRNPYVVLLSADDKLTPYFLEKVAHQLETHPDADVVFTDLQHFGNSTKVWQYGVYDEKTMTQRQWVPSPASVMKRQVWEDAGGHYEGPELKYGNVDWDFWLSAITPGLHFVHVPEPLYLYRVHGSSVSDKRDYHDHRTREFMYNRHRHLFDKYRTGDAFRLEGMQRSAGAAWKRGEYRLAKELAFKAYQLSPSRTPRDDVDHLFNQMFQQLKQEHPQLDLRIQQLKDQLSHSDDHRFDPTRENVRVYKELGRIAAAMGGFDAAETYLLYAIAMVRNSAETARLCNLLGLVFMKKKDWLQAEETFKLTLHYDPGNRGVYQHKAGLYLETRQYPPALHSCATGLSLMPSNPKLIIRLGQIVAVWQEQSGKIGEDSIAELERIVRSLSLPVNDIHLEVSPGTGASSFLYTSEVGRRIYWISRSKGLYDQYGNTHGGYETLEKTITTVSPQRLLEIGCGNGRNFPLYHRLKVPETVAQDISLSALELAEARNYKNITCTPTPITDLDFPDNHFHLAISNRVLQHIPPQSVETVIAALCRIASRVYVNEATPEEVGNRFESFYMFVHNYIDLFASYGFEVAMTMNEEKQTRYLFKNYNVELSEKK